MIFRNKRTPSEYIGYGLYFYFSGLSLRKAAEIDYQIALSKETMFLSGTDGFKNKPQISSNKKKKLSEYVIAKTVIKVGSEYIWIWVATIELESKEILGISVSKEQNMFVDIERFISDVIEEHGEHPVSKDGGTWYPPQVCRFLKLTHHIHSSYEKSIIIERTMLYIKDSTECFDDYFPCRKKKCN